MTLTVREKEHWQERISRRIDHAIEKFQSQNDPEIWQRIRQQAEQEAKESLGIAEAYAEAERIKEEIARLEQARQHTWTTMLATITKVSVATIYPHHSEPYEVRRVLDARRDLREKELLRQHPLGQYVLRLQTEKEELLDTIWLATSPSHIKTLWSRFAEVLQWEPPEMQKQAIALTPPDNDEADE